MQLYWAVNTLSGDMTSVAYPFVPSSTLNIVIENLSSTVSVLLFEKGAIGSCYCVSKNQYTGQSICHLLCLLTRLN